MTDAFMLLPGVLQFCIVAFAACFIGVALLTLEDAIRQALAARRTTPRGRRVHFK